MQHHTESAYMTEVPFQPLWAQEAPPPPPIVPYQDLIAGYPCSDLGMLAASTKEYTIRIQLN